MVVCYPFDVACQVTALVTPWVLPAVLFLVSLFGIVAARTLKGKAAWAAIVLFEVWWFIPVTGFSLRELFGSPSIPYFGG